MKAFHNETQGEIVPSDEAPSSVSTLTEPLLASQPAAVAPNDDSPIGTDVHGDGFDEIIPSTAPVKPPASLKQSESKEEMQAPTQAQSSELPPERELSPEEVEKLLGGGGDNNP